ncbi:MAG: hypothetical protein J6V78_00815 [Clostridia bacterium]|nr:hypothetical protein [Clostridia bacterium]
MTNVEKYRAMVDESKKYSTLIENLKNQVYGYNVYLTHIAVQGFPEFSFKETSKEYKVINDFVDKIINYYKTFDENISDIFSYPFEEKDAKTIKNMLYVILGFLMSECRKEDYTFLGVVKLLKTFMGNVPKEYNNDKAKSVFYRIWTGMSERSKNNMPPVLTEAFDNLYEDFDYNYLKRIADGIWNCIRFYLYDNNLEYTGDSFMMTATNDLILEISERLFNIQQNKRPHKSRLESGLSE